MKPPQFASSQIQVRIRWVLLDLRGQVGDLLVQIAMGTHLLRLHGKQSGGEDNEGNLRNGHDDGYRRGVVTVTVFEYGELPTALYALTR